MSDVLGLAMESAKGLSKSEKMSKAIAVNKSLELVQNCGFALLGSNGAGGYPNIKAMIKAEAEGIKTIWFGTNSSTLRVAQFKKDSRACVYFQNEHTFKGLMLVGDIEVLTDAESRNRLWKEELKMYFPLGVDDPTFTVLRFATKWANYYEGLANVSFDISDICENNK